MITFLFFGCHASSTTKENTLVTFWDFVSRILFLVGSCFFCWRLALFGDSARLIDILPKSLNHRSISSCEWSVCADHQSALPTTGSGHRPCPIWAHSIVASVPGTTVVRGIYWRWKLMLNFLKWRSPFQKLCLFWDVIMFCICNTSDH